MSVDSCFYIIQEEKLKNFLYNNLDDKIVKSVEKKQWRNIISTLRDTNEFENNSIKGFKKFPEKHKYFNSSITTTLLQVIDCETEVEESLTGWSATYETFLNWTDKVLMLLKMIYEYKNDETIWKLSDIVISKETAQEINKLFEKYKDYEYNNYYPIDFVELSQNWRMIYQLKNEVIEQHADGVYFYVSY